MQVPQTIKLNAIDRAYLVPETQDDNGAYFPMALVIGIELREALTVEQLTAALLAVEMKYPQFRLGYTLDYTRERLQRVADPDLPSHFAAMVQSGPAANHDGLVSNALCTNPDPLSRPVQITIHDCTLLIKLQHSFGDGRFVMQLIPIILLAALDRPAFDRLPPLPPNFSLPMWKVVWQTPRQGFNTLWNWLHSLRSTVQDFSAAPASAAVDKVQEPVRSGTPMQSVRYVINAPVLDRLDEMRHSASSGDVKVSLNTIVQALFAHRLMELGLQASPPTYTIPTDLKRYLRRAENFQPGNLAGQIRVKTSARSAPDWRADCLEMQANIDNQLRRGMPLWALPNEWLFRLGGRKMVRKFNREWLLNSPQNDPRVFVVTNLGKLDSDWTPVLPYLDRSTSISFGVPLMGAPPLVIALFTLAGQGHLTIVYNPALITAPQINEVIETLSPDWLDKKQSERM